MNLNVVRPVKVTGVSRTTMGTFLVDTDCLLGGSVARWEARTVISGEWVGLVRCLSKAVPPDSIQGVRFWGSRIPKDARQLHMIQTAAGSLPAVALVALETHGWTRVCISKL